MKKCVSLPNKHRPTMETKEYENDNPVTEASEPTAVYQVSSSARATTDRSRSMTVDEYFDKVRKALDKRYENL